MECDFGVMEGKTSKELEGTESLRSFLCDGINYKIEGGESGMEFLTRLEKGITEVFSDMMKEKITNAACVTHGGVITLLLCALGLPSPGGLCLDAPKRHRLHHFVYPGHVAARP